MRDRSSNLTPPPPQQKVWHITVRQPEGGDERARIHFANSDPAPDDVMALIAPCGGLDARILRLERRVSNPNVFLIDVEIRRTQSKSSESLKR